MRVEISCTVDISTKIVFRPSSSIDRSSGTQREEFQELRTETVRRAEYP